MCSHTLARANAARSRKTPKFFDTPNGKSWWVNFPSSHRRSFDLKILVPDGASGSFSGPFFLAKTPDFPLFFFLPTNRPVLSCSGGVLWVWSGSKPRRHTNYGGHERTDSLGFGLRCCCCCCWHWPNGRLGPASQSAYTDDCMIVCVSIFPILGTVPN